MARSSGARPHVARVLIPCAVAAALWCLAPPGSNAFWAVNGFRSLGVAAAAGLVLVALAASALPAARSGAAAWGVIAGAAAFALAGPLRERLHFLGDSHLRLRAIEHLRILPAELHANPLDLLVNALATTGLVRLGLESRAAIGVISFVLACVFFAGVWRLTAALVPAPPVARSARHHDTRARVAFAALLAATGSLEAFAGTAESAGLLLATAVWWWVAMLRPLDRPRRAIELAAAWVLVFLAHRLALVLLLPLAWRAFAPAPEGDRPAGRRALAWALAAALAIAVATSVFGPGSEQAARDFASIAAAVTFAAGHRPLGVHDVLNGIVLVAPLVLLVPLVLGPAAATAWWRSREGRPALVAAIALLPLAAILPGTPDALGAQRDWDLGVLFGLTLTLAMTAALARATEPSRTWAVRGALVVAVLAAGSWVLVNADETASARRALAMLDSTPALHPHHRSAAHAFLGQRSMDLRNAELAGRHYEQSFDLVRNGRLALLAAEAYAVGGRADESRRMLDRARRETPLGPELESIARQIEQMLER